MSQKQDRINEVLAERISQLESELRVTLNGKDRAEKETRLVKEEAYEVVGQWSAENAELRQKVSDLEESCATTRAALKNRDETVACLKEELSVAQQLATQYSTTIAELQQQKTESEKKMGELTNSLTTAESTVVTSAEQIDEYKRLVSKFETELKELVAAQQNDHRNIEELSKSLAAVSDENSVLRQAGADVSSNTAKLLERVRKLKDENESLIRSRDRFYGEAQGHKAQADRLQLDLTQKMQQCERLTAELACAATEVQRLASLTEALESKLSEATISLRVSETVAAQQLELIQNLEEDLQELRDSGITGEKALNDLYSDFSFSKERVEKLTKEKEDLETEFTTVKECYSTLLLEFDDHKRASARAVETLTKDLAQATNDFAERISLLEQSNSAAMSSVQDLTGALHAQQNSEFAKKEQIQRLTVSLEQQIGLNSIHDIHHRALTQFISKLQSTIEKTVLLRDQAVQAAAREAEHFEAVSNRQRLSEQTLSEQRKTISALETQLSQSNARLKECTAERDTVVSDNEWLKSQVESMRQELGELDDLLNANLNEMREENERLQLENDKLQQQVSASAEKDQQHEAAAKKTEAGKAALETELRAQTKTLEITEAELQAAKAQVENVSTSLHYLQKRTEELEALNEELVRTNAALAGQNALLEERVESQDAKLSSVLSDKRKESDTVKAKLNQYVEMCEKTERLLRAESDAKKSAEGLVASTKEQNSKLRAALDELKARCASDASSLRELLAERDDLMRDRDIIVEKYNKLHDAFCNVRKEAHGKVADELRKVMELAESQEAELQTLRQQNITLKKSISMFVESAQPKAEAIFMERLNLTEGPLRHPKKRSAANAKEQKLES